jgi:hypothetical protein
MKALMISLLFTVSSAYAADASEPPIKMICVTEFPTTSFEIKQIGDKVQVHLVHHNGPKYAPFHDAILVPNDLDEMKAQADTIQKLGDEWVFNFKRSDCKALSETFFSCQGRADSFDKNGLKVSPWSLSVSDIEQKNMSGTYTLKKVSLNFSVNGKDLLISSNYQPGECAKIQF